MPIQQHPRIPFDQTRNRSQPRGLLNRNSGKILIGLLILVVVLLVSFTLLIVTALNPGGEDASAAASEVRHAAGEVKDAD